MREYFLCCLTIEMRIHATEFDNIRTSIVPYRTVQYRKNIFKCYLVITGNYYLDELSFAAAVRILWLIQGLSFRRKWMSHLL